MASTHAIYELYVDGLINVNAIYSIYYIKVDNPKI